MKIHLVLLGFLWIIHGGASISDVDLEDLKPLMNQIKNGAQFILDNFSLVTPNDVVNSLKEIINDIDRNDVLDAVRTVKSLVQEKLGFLGNLFSSRLQSLETTATTLEQKYRAAEQRAANGGCRCMHSLIVSGLMMLVVIFII